MSGTQSGEPDQQRSVGADLIAAERHRQVDAEGWTPEHDDEHDDGALVSAAVCYEFAALALVHNAEVDAYEVLDFWPWDESWWKPSDDPIRNLVKAGALIAAEIDRLGRLTRCTGGRMCPAILHVHGCYSDHGTCDSPTEHAAPGGHSGSTTTEEADRG